MEKLYNGRWLWCAIFFMISGFILSLPFAKAHFNKGRKKKISLKRYYLRRLIRLEPPYIIALIIFFIGNVWVLHKYSFDELLPHFFASAFYLHNTIYNEFSYVLPIAWSLEVEVQFYLLAPLLCSIYLIRSKYLRWAIFVAAIIASGIYNYQFIMGNVVKFFCCFGIGMLITDFYCNKEKLISFPCIVLRYWNNFPFDYCVCSHTNQLCRLLAEVFLYNHFLLYCVNK